MHAKRFYIISVSLTLLITMQGLIYSGLQAHVHLSEQKNHNLGKLGVYDLVAVGGSWEFFDHMLYQNILEGVPHQPAMVTVPHEWEASPEYMGKPYGYATYRTRVEGLDPDQNYGIFLNDVSTAYRLYINGKYTMGAGVVSKDKEDSSPLWQVRWASFRPDMLGVATVVVEVSNYQYNRGGLWLAPLVGSVEAVSKHLTGQLVTEAMLFAAAFIMGFYFFALHAKSGGDSPGLYLGVFSLLVAARDLFSGSRLIFNLYPELPWETALRVEYLVGYLLLPVAFYLIATRSLGRLKKISIYLGHLNLIPSVLLPLIAPITIFTGYITVFKYLVLLASACVVLMLIQLFQRETPGAPPVAIGFGVLVLGAVAELFVGGIPYVVGYATLAMIAIFAIVEIQNFATMKQQKERLETEVHLDRLTGVQNRLALEKLLAGDGLEARKHHVWHVLFIDVNRFKQINDTLGHQVGDQVLREVGRILREAVRDADHIYRYGGDEFVILADMKDHQSDEDLIARIHALLVQPIEADGDTVQISLSIGSTLYDPAKETLKDAILRSDDAMYQVKQNGFHAEI